MAVGEMDREWTDSSTARRMLVVIKTLHTLVWAFMVLCIVSIPVLGAWGLWRLTVWAAGLVFCECAILLANGWKCPMTHWAARYTNQRHDNFDIYLPLWLARHNKTIFSILFAVNLLALAVEWFGGRV
jgi:hypothetical protein